MWLQVPSHYALAVSPAPAPLHPPTGNLGRKQRQRQELPSLAWPWVRAYFTLICKVAELNQKLPHSPDPSSKSLKGTVVGGEGGGHISNYSLIEAVLVLSAC